ncbi:NADH-ubiquinone oxidoreductase chain 4, partial [Ophiophagus hannah]
MLKLIYITAILIPTALLLKPKILFQTTTSYSFILALFSLNFLTPKSNLQHALSKEPLQRQRTFLTTLIFLQLFISLTFMAYTLTLIYIIFEATIIPTLIIITRWGQQAERLTAGTYFILYTLTTSIPLLIATLFINNISHTPTLFLQITQPANQ